MHPNTDSLCPIDYLFLPLSLVLHHFQMMVLGKNNYGVNEKKSAIIMRFFFKKIAKHTQKKMCGCVFSDLFSIVTFVVI